MTSAKKSRDFPTFENMPSDLLPNAALRGRPLSKLAFSASLISSTSFARNRLPANGHHHSRPLLCVSENPPDAKRPMGTEPNPNK